MFLGSCGEKSELMNVLHIRIGDFNNSFQGLILPMQLLYKS